MATHVIIKNYKTLKHVEFVIDGYTVLYGKNYIGKSALITAILSALSNRAGDGFIRRGETFAEVCIRRDNYEVVWHKEKNNSFYLISDGVSVERFDKIGKSDIPQPLADMGFAPLDLGGSKTLLWYAKQMEVLFLIDKPKTDFATDIIASVTNMDAVYKAVDLAKKELKDSKNELKVRTADLKMARMESSRYSDLDLIEPLSLEVEKTLSSCSSLEKDIAFLGESLSSVVKWRGELSRFYPATTVTVVDMSSAGKALSTYEKICDLLFQSQRSSLALSKAEDELGKTVLVSTECFPLVDSLVNEVESLQSFHSKYESALDAVVNARVPETQDLSGSLDVFNQDLRYFFKQESLLREYESSQDELRVLSDRIALLDSRRTTALPDSLFKEVAKLRDLVRLRQEAVDNLVKAKKEWDDATRACDETQSELDEFECCPTCGASL